MAQKRAAPFKITRRVVDGIPMAVFNRGVNYTGTCGRKKAVSHYKRDVMRWVKKQKSKGARSCKITAKQGTKGKVRATSTKRRAPTKRRGSAKRDSRYYSSPAKRSAYIAKHGYTAWMDSKGW